VFLWKWLPEASAARSNPSAGNTLLSPFRLPLPAREMVRSPLPLGQRKDGFLASEDPAYFHLDDVSVAPVSPVPEPASLTLFGLGLVPLAGYAWRRRQKAAG
jgi:hypothetical protein